MATPFPPPPPPPPPARRANTAAVASLVVLAVVGVALALVLVRTSGDDDGGATQSPSTTPPRSSTSTTRTATTIASTAKTAPVYGTTECPPAGGTAEIKRSFTAPFRQCIDVAKKYTAVVTTNKGELTIQLDPIGAPLTVNNFVSLARSRYYDATQCHRIIPAFVVQCGDPTGVGTGGPGYKFVDELPRSGQYKIGSVAMANSGPGTNGSQFFIITGNDGVVLPPSYTLFGQVTAGMDTTLKALNSAGTASGTPIEVITITSVRITEA